jgi:hypothetical protein
MSNSTLSKIRAAVGRKGGQTTVERHGKEHMSKIGKRGAEVFHEKYSLEPIYRNDFAIRLRKPPHTTVALLSGKPVQEGE